jgi:hypothetical protein
MAGHARSGRRAEHHSFATDDTEAFIAFLRSLKGVRVEVTSTQIRVSGN